MDQLAVIVEELLLSLQGFVPVDDASPHGAGFALDQTKGLVRGPVPLNTTEFFGVVEVLKDIAVDLNRVPDTSLVVVGILPLATTVGEADTGVTLE